MIEIKTNISPSLFIFPDAKILDGLYQKIDKLSKKYNKKLLYLPFGKNESYSELGRCFYLGWWDLYCPIKYFPKQKEDLYYIKKVLPKKPKTDELWVFTTSFLENLDENIHLNLKKSQGLHILLNKESKKWKITRVS
jgi:hypothetical protein